MCFLWQDQLVNVLKILRLLDENGYARVGSYSHHCNRIYFENEPDFEGGLLGWTI